MASKQDRPIYPSEISPEILKQLDGLMHSGVARLTGPNGESIELPPILNDYLLKIVEAMKRKQTIVLMPQDESFTTQAAANFLGMSRPYLLRLLEAGKIPFHRVGTHRKIKFKDLVDFQTERSRTRNKALSDLTKELDESGVYDRKLDSSTNNEG